MAKNFQIDGIDKIILKYLMRNARTPFLQIARACGVSGAAIHQRVKKLIDANVLEESKFIVNPDMFGYKTCAYIGVFLEKAKMYKNVIDEFNNIPEIVECHYTTGNYAVFLKIYSKDNKHLMEVLNNTIQSIDGVASTETFISLDQSIDRQISV